MRAAHIVDFETPRGYHLNGIWFGIHEPHTVYIWVHGLTGGAFSGRHIIEKLAKNKAAGLTFNTRGAAHVSTVKRTRGKKTDYHVIGTAFEKFTDCVDDIDGAVRFAKASGAKNIFLIGHSTGCQKSIYWASKKRKGVTGIILLAPLSDFADTFTPRKKEMYAKGLKWAHEMSKKGKGSELMPREYTEWLVLSADRYLSLYTPNSIEEIFTYSQKNKVPRTFKRANVPVLSLFAEKDEFLDRSLEEIMSWFQKQRPQDQVKLVRQTNHGFKGAETKVASIIKSWSRKIS